MKSNQNPKPWKREQLSFFECEGESKMLQERGKNGLRNKLVKDLRDKFPNAVVISHEDKYTYGIPDISFTRGGITTWIEVKVAQPKIKKGREIQLFVTQSLEIQGWCFYIVYQEKKNGEQFAYIVSPKVIKNNNWENDYFVKTGNFNSELIFDFLSS